MLKNIDVLWFGGNIPPSPYEYNPEWLPYKAFTSGGFPQPITLSAPGELTLFIASSSHGRSFLKIYITDFNALTHGAYI